MATDTLEHLRRICLALPEATERFNHGSPTWAVRNKRTFATFADHVHGDDHVSLWCPAPPGAQEEMLATDPERFFRPPYVGPSGWLGVYLDVEVDWIEIAEIVTDAYRVVAPKSLVAVIDQ